MRSVDEVRKLITDDWLKHSNMGAPAWGRRWGLAPESAKLIIRGGGRADLIIGAGNYRSVCPSLSEYKSALMAELQPILPQEPVSKVIRHNINNGYVEEVSLERLMQIRAYRDQRPKTIPDCIGVWLMIDSSKGLERGMNIVLDVDDTPHLIDTSGTVRIVEQPDITYRLLHRASK